MRKAQREITDFNDIINLINRCQTIRLGLCDNDVPYVVPLSFGFEVVNDKPVFYFHCAKEGKKVDILAKNNRVCVEVDLLNGYVKTEHGVTADYESVIAFGRAEEVSEEEAIHGIELLLSHCGIEDYSARECVKMGIVAVYKIEADQISGKKRFLER